MNKKVTNFYFTEKEDNKSKFTDIQREEIRNILSKEIEKNIQSAIFTTSNKINTIILETVKTEIKNANLYGIIGEIVEQYVKINVKPIIEQVIEKQVSLLNKKLTREYVVAKELSYSINAEIKHTLMKAPISYTTEQEIKDNILSKLNKLQTGKFKLLEDKG